MSKNSEDLSDDFVASILSKEASEKNIRYSVLGLQAFLPKRSATNAPKPNTRFLRNIVREADSHNAALLAKEAEESKERLRILHLKEGENQRGEMGVNGAEGGGEKSRAAQRPDRQIYKVGAKWEAQAKRDSARDEGGRVEREKERKRRRSRSREGREDERSKRHRSRSVDKRSRSPGAERERGRHRRGSRSRERKRSGERKGDRSKEHKRSRSDDRRKSDSNRYHRHYTSRHHSSKDVDGSRHSHRSRSHERSTDKSKATSAPHRSDKKDRSSDISTKPRSSRPRSPRRRPDESDADRERRRKRRKEMEMNEEPDHSSSRASTDPLLSIIGPAPPPPTRTRGRGTISGSSAMDARFSEQYDPAMDVRPHRNDEGDDWDNAIEAYRDRQKWKALGAERLRSAGFGEDFITAWENNDTKNTANIKWAKEGVREWDRGKVIEEGEVKVRASWVKD